MPNPATNPILTCGFCANGNHEKCPRAIRAGTRLWNCQCTGCEKPLRCTECHNTNAKHINPDTWLCRDRKKCAARVQERLDANPVIQQIRLHRERAKRKMSETTQTVEAAPKATRTGVCIVTGQPTKGGKFAPGMDARYVSLKVAEVLAGDNTEAGVIEEMRGHDLSQVLQDKFRRSLQLAHEREIKKAKAAEKREADALQREAEKKAKAEAKAAAKAEAKAATATPVVDESVDEDYDEDDDIEDEDYDEDDDEDADTRVTA